MRLLTGLILVAGLNACAHTGAGGAPTADADDQAAAELREHHRHHHRGGVAQFIAMSLDTLGADDAKRPEIEKLQSDLYACMAPARDVEKKLLLTMADGVAAGAIVPANVDPILTQLEGTVATVQDCSADALNKLHALLSPAERATLVEKVQAHWEVWRQSHEEKAGGREKGGRLAELTRELGLSADQVEKMSAALQAEHAGAANFDPAKVQAHVEAFAAAFVQESFDAKSVGENANAHLATHGGKRMVAFYETVAPLLTPEQRTKLAEHLREHASNQPVSAK